MITPRAQWETSPFHLKAFMFPAILPMVAAAAPADWDVMILDEVHNELDFELDVDVVGVSTMITNRARGIEIAREYRRRGRTVIVGGPDASVAADKYLPHFDAILSGDAFGYLPKILADWEAGKLQKFYVNSHGHNLVGLPFPRNDLISPRRYLNYHNILVSTSCPYACEYCGYAKDNVARLRPPEEVAAAIRYSRAKAVWLEAPELLAYKHYVKKLEPALKGLRVHWATHASIKSCADEAVLRSAYRAGMRRVNLGIESFSQEALTFVNKRANKVADYLPTFRLLDRVGVSATAHIMFGIPHDGPQFHELALETLRRGRVSHVTHHVLGAGPDNGRAAFEKKLREAGGRPLLVQEVLWAEGKDRSVCLYRSGKETDQEFSDGAEKFMDSFLSFPSIFQRVFLRSPANLPNLAPDLLANLLYKVRRVSVHGEDFSVFRFFDRAFGLPKGHSRRLTEELERARPSPAPFGVTENLPATPFP